jgi:hypothetical protein
MEPRISQIQLHCQVTQTNPRNLWLSCLTDKTKVKAKINR